MKKQLILILLFFCVFKAYSNSYQDLLKEIKSEVNCYQQEYESMSNKDSVLDVAGKYLHTVLSTRVYSHWKGTPWDFNGYINTPGKGVIACGYFVSTTLKHVGVKINRYKMAQQSALNEVKTLEDNYVFFKGGKTQFMAYVKKKLACRIVCFRT